MTRGFVELMASGTEGSKDKGSGVTTSGSGGSPQPQGSERLEARASPVAT